MGKSKLDEWTNTIQCMDCLEGMKQLPDGCVDLVVTDPPYGYSFMGKDWDRAVPKAEVWKECLRVMKPGAFGFILCAPRQDCLSRMIVNLEEAGFWVNFSSIYWAYASGFPKAQNISKVIDKRLGMKRKSIGQKKLNPRDKKAYTPNVYDGLQGTSTFEKNPNMNMITVSSSPQAKAFDGSYAGFQPKPAVEVVLVVMKPLSEKTFADQALKNGKGVTWLDGGRIPYESERDFQTMGRGKVKQGAKISLNKFSQGVFKDNVSPQGRFPANLLVQDDVLNVESKGAFAPVKSGQKEWGGKIYGKFKSSGDNGKSFYGDSGSFSRYFDLDRWFAEKIKQLPESVQKTFPFLIVAKASKSEKNKGLEGKEFTRKCRWNNAGKWQDLETKKYGNIHPTVKPLKLMCYLITLGSRAGDVVLDPYIGSGTTALGCQILNRRYIGFDNEQTYIDIANERLKQEVFNL